MLYDNNSMNRQNALAPNWRNSLPTYRQRTCNQRIDCLQMLGLARAFGPGKRLALKMIRVFFIENHYNII